LGGTGNGTFVTATGASLQLDGTTFGTLAVVGEALSLNGTGISGNGALRNLGGANSWSGAVTLAGAATIQSDAGSLELTGGITNGGNTLTVQGAANTTVSTAAISGAGGLTKTGAGTLTLSAANTYNGATTVSNGTLIVNGSISTSVSTTVSTGGTLAGTGTVGSTTIQTTGILVPGDGGIESLNTGALTLDSGSFSNFEINAALDTSDLAISSALLAFGGTLNVSNINGTLVANDTFNLFDWSSTSGTFGTINLPALDPGLSWDTGSLYTNGTITVIPEPNVAALLGGLGILVLLRRRR
jgi:autotransporter-associated beta strand protein